MVDVIGELISMVDVIGELTDDDKIQYQSSYILHNKLQDRNLYVVSLPLNGSL